MTLLTRGPYEVLRGNRALALLVAGEGLSSLADWLLTVTLAALVYRVTRSYGAVALISFARLAPYALVLPWSGAVLDRVDRRLFMAGLGLGRAIIVLGLLAVHSRTSLLLAYPLVFLSSSLSCVLRPTVNSTLPDIVEEREAVAANSLVSQVDGLAHIIGPALAGALIALNAFRPALLAVSLTFLLCGLAFFLAPLRRGGAPGFDLSPAEALAGFRYLWSENERVLAALATAAAGLGLLAGAYYTLAVALANKVFHYGSQGVGWLDTAYGIGGLVAGLLMGWLIRSPHVAGLFIAGTAVNALGVLLLAVSPAGPAPFVCIGMVGIADVVIQVSGTTILQASAPRDMLARVFIAFEATLVLATLTGALLAGPLLRVADPRLAAVVYGLAAGLLLLLSLPRLRALDDVLGLRVFLRTVPLLAELSRPLLDELATRFEPISVPPGAPIVSEGEPGDRFYIVRTGEVEVVVGGRPVRKLGPAAYFGELALLHAVPRTASVRASAPTQLFSLDRAAFQELLQRDGEMGSRLAQGAERQYEYAPSTLLLPYWAGRPGSG
jgi:MFS family permease